ISARQFLATGGELAAAPGPLVALKLSHAGPHVHELVGERALARFRALEFSHSRFTDDGFQRLIRCRHLARLRGLDLRDFAPDRTQLEELVTTETFSNLRRLFLSHVTAGAPHVALAKSPTMANLEELFLNMSNFSPAAAAVFVRSPHLAR